MTLAETLRRIERALVLRAMRHARGSRREAAALLGVTETTVSRLVARHGLADALREVRVAAGYQLGAKGREAVQRLRAVDPA